MTPLPTPETAALVVIDPQRGFSNQWTQAAEPVMAALLRHWQDAGGTAIVTRFVNQPGSLYERLLGWDRMGVDDAGQPFVASLAGSAWRSDVIVKGTYSAVDATVHGMIKGAGVDAVALCGLDTESCVLASAVRAFDLGIVPWVVTDATATHAGPEAHAAGLLVLSRTIGARQLITSDQILTRRAA